MTKIKFYFLFSVFCAAIFLSSPCGAADDVFALIDKGDADGVRAAIAEGIDVNGRDKSGTTPLMFLTVKAGLNENFPQETFRMLLKILLEGGADLNARNGEGSTALIWAAAMPNDYVAAELIDAGADVTIKEDSGATAFHWAAMMGSLKVIDKLAASGLNIRETDSSGRTVLHWAVMGNPYKEAVKRLIDLGADVNAQEEHNVPPIWFACMYGASNVAAALLESGVDANIRSDGVTLLHLAAGYGKKAIKDLATGPELQAVEDNAVIPFSLLGVVKALVEAGADVNALSGKTNNAGRRLPRQFSEKTPLDFAEALGETDIVRYLKSAGAESAKKWYWPF